MVNQGPSENPKRAPSHDTDGIFHVFDRVFKKKQGPYVEIRQREKLKKQLAKQKKENAAKLKKEKMPQMPNGKAPTKKDLMRLQEMMTGKNEK